MARKTTRKTIPKSVRFEVFKRDKFTCQYCGGSAPNVILELDHVVPVSKGGSDDVMNLVTSCRECNRGKSDRTLNDDSVVVRQKRQLDALQERREQIEMMIEWRQSLEEEREIEVDAISRLFHKKTGLGLRSIERNALEGHIIKFGFNEVYTACEIALAQYYRENIRERDYAFGKIGGICYNRKNGM